MFVLELSATKARQPTRWAPSFHECVFLACAGDAELLRVKATVRFPAHTFSEDLFQIAIEKTGASVEPRVQHSGNPFAKVTVPVLIVF